MDLDHLHISSLHILPGLHTLPVLHCWARISIILLMWEIFLQQLNPRSLNELTFQLWNGVWIIPNHHLDINKVLKIRVSVRHHGPLYWPGSGKAPADRSLDCLCLLPNNCLFQNTTFGYADHSLFEHHPQRARNGGFQTTNSWVSPHLSPTVVYMFLRC